MSARARGWSGAQRRRRRRSARAGGGSTPPVAWAREREGRECSGVVARALPQEARDAAPSPGNGDSGGSSGNMQRRQHASCIIFSADLPNNITLSAYLVLVNRAYIHFIKTHVAQNVFPMTGTSF